VSEPTYRIVTEYDPQFDYMPWLARVYAIADGILAYVAQDTEEEKAVSAAQQYIVRSSSDLPIGRTLYTSEDGEIVPAPAEARA
jgi:hypothetical protein